MQRFMRATLSKSAIGFGLIFLAGFPSPLDAQGSSNPCGIGPEYARREALLRTTVNQLLEAIKTHNGQGVVRHIDKDGISVWGGTLSQTEITKEFHNKSGLYCLLFSTACVTRTKFPGDAYINTSKWKVSYSAWLSRHSPIKIEPEMFYGGEDNPCHANVSIRSESKAGPDEETFELGFDYRKDSWKLVSTPAYPEGIAFVSPFEKLDPRQTEALKWQP